MEHISSYFTCLFYGDICQTYFQLLMEYSLLFSIVRQNIYQIDYIQKTRKKCQCSIVQRIVEPHGNKNYGVRWRSCIPFFFACDVQGLSAHLISDGFLTFLSVWAILTSVPPIATLSKKESGRAGSVRERHLPEAHCLITCKMINKQ